MKKKRFLTIFLLCTLTLHLWALPLAAAEEVTPVTDPDLNAKAALLVDANTGAVIYAKNEHQEMYPASLTKIMTALLTLEAVKKGQLSLSQELTASATALEGLAEDGSSANIQVGEIMTVENLLYCMMVVSANEACDILAEAVSGTVDAFVNQMNQRAAALGCENTHFVNPNGLHDAQHYTSAWDMYLITREAMKYPDFMRVCDLGDTTIPATNLSKERKLHSTNYLLSTWFTRGYIYKDAHGIKTGHTSDAGHCLVSSASRGSLSLISVVLGCDRVTLDGGEIRTYSFYDTRLLFDWAFNNFSYQTVLESHEVVGEAAVELSKTDVVALHPAQNVKVLLPNDLKAEDLKRVVTLEQEPVDAPISQGDMLGSLELKYNDKVYAKVDLLAFSDVEVSQLLVLWRDVREFFSRTSVRIVCAMLVVLMVWVLLWKLIFSRRRYRYGRSVGRGSGREGYRGRRR